MSKTVKLGIDTQIVDGELVITISDEAKAKMAADPKLDAIVKDLLAAFHQAHNAVHTGQHKTIDDALEAITGNRPQLIHD